jgi:hypothetical protein
MGWGKIAEMGPQSQLVFYTGRKKILKCLWSVLLNSQKRKSMTFVMCIPGRIPSIFIIWYKLYDNDFLAFFLWLQLLDKKHLTLSCSCSQ